MLRLASALYSIVGTTLAGILIIAALTMGYDTFRTIIIAAVVGFVVAVPVAWLIAKAIIEQTSRR